MRIPCSTALLLLLLACPAATASTTSPRTRVAFVCLVSSDKGLVAVKAELKKALASLRPVQSFDIVIPNEKGQAVVLSIEPLLATPENKKRGKACIDAIQPVAIERWKDALTSAFGRKFDRVYLLTDAVTPPKDLTAEQIARLNTEKIRVSCILYTPPTKEMEAFTKSVVEQNRGTYRVSDGKDSE